MSVENALGSLKRRLKRREIRGSHACAVATVRLMLEVIASTDSEDSKVFLKRIRDVGSALIQAQPKEVAIANIVRRVLGIVREVAEDNGAAASCGGVQPSGPALFNVFSLGDATGSSHTVPFEASSNLKGINGQQDVTQKLDLKAEIQDGIGELMDEIEVADSQIAESATDYIGNGENVLITGSSFTVQKFLSKAAKKRIYTVWQVDGYPNEYDITQDTVVRGATRLNEDGSTGEKLKPLTEVGIQVNVVQDAEVFAIMPRINKVILEAHTVFANGSFVAATGATVILQAAKAHRVPVLVLSAVYKLSPTHPTHQHGMTEYGDPGKVVPYQDDDFIDSIVNPVTDFGSAELVDLYITNLGGHAAGDMHRVATDHYNMQDINLI